jgi:metallo-beta-lactamase class B
MLRQLKESWFPITVGVGVVFVLVMATVVYPAWRSAVDKNTDVRADPHHIAGNLYFVGDPANASFLLTGPAGDLLIASGDDRSAHKIIDNITQLGFDIRNVRALLAAGGHPIAELQHASGAQVWASEDDAAVIASGGKDDPSRVYPPYQVLSWVGVNTYAAARVDHRVTDGETIHVGPLAVTGHLTPGSSRGCMTWTFVVHDHGRDLTVVHRCSLTPPIGASLVAPEKYPGIREDFERSFRTLRGLPVDIWLTAEGREYGRFRKYDASLHADDPVAPFIDPKGYFDSIDTAERNFRKLLADQQHK